MESSGHGRLRECQIEQERRYERARQDLARATEAWCIQKSYCINTNTGGMRKKKSH